MGFERGQKFTGERLTHDVLGLTWRDLIWADSFQLDDGRKINFLAAACIRAEHLARYDFVAREFDFFGKKVFDIACGVGYGWGKNGNGAWVVGADIDYATVFEAHQFYGDGGRVFNIADGCSLPFADSSFDMVTSFETIEHVEKPEVLLAELVRVLDSDGQLVISTPNRDVTSPGATLDDRPGNPFHKLEFSLAEFENLLSGCFNSVLLYGQAQQPSFFLRNDALGYRLIKKASRVLGLLNPEKSVGVSCLKDGFLPTYIVAVCGDKKIK